MNMPILTIVTVSYNSSATIRQTIDSVHKYFGDYLGNEVEYLIVDGNSKDGTVDIVKQMSNGRISIVSESDRGIFDAMNKGVVLARGHYVWFLNSDDFINLDCRYSAINLVTDLQQLKCDVIVANINMGVEVEGNFVIKRRWKSYINTNFIERYGWHPPHPAFICTKNAILLAGCFDIDKSIAADYKLMVKVLESKPRIHSTDANLVNMRIGGNSTSSLAAIYRSNLQAFKSLREIGYTSTKAFFTILAKIFFKFRQH